MDLIKELWRGDVPLSTTFWRFGFGINFLLNAAFLYYVQRDVLTTAIGMILLLLLVSFFVIYGPFILIAIWRSANKYQGFQRNAIAAKLWCYLAGADVFSHLQNLLRSFPVNHA